MEEGKLIMGLDLEREKAESNVDVIFPDGFGYGEGGISVQKQLDTKELSQESLDQAVDIVLHDPEVFVNTDADANDDGCGDGRITKAIYRVLNPITREVQRFSKSLRRAKLFGRGLVTASSMWRAVDTSSENKTLRGDRVFVATLLKQKDIHHGAHTAAGNTQGENCGCGAIDNYALITRNAVKYKSQILKTLDTLYGGAYADNVEAVESVYDTYVSLTTDYFAGTSGKETMEMIESEGAVVKELEGGHKEDMVIINDVDGTTFDQDALRRKLTERGLSPDIQAFVVDAWRGRMYADFISDYASAHGHNKDSAYKLAYADFLIRTLAVSATLTAGDQVVVYRSAA